MSRHDTTADGDGDWITICAKCQRPGADTRASDGRMYHRRCRPVIGKRVA